MLQVPSTRMRGKYTLLLQMEFNEQTQTSVVSLKKNSGTTYHFKQIQRSKDRVHLFKTYAIHSKGCLRFLKNLKGIFCHYWNSIRKRHKIKVDILSLAVWETKQRTQTLPSLNWDKFWSGTDFLLWPLSHFLKNTQSFASGLRFRHHVIYIYIHAIMKHTLLFLMFSIPSMH
jgi:hypothetical protein